MSLRWWGFLKIRLEYLCGAKSEVLVNGVLTYGRVYNLLFVCQPEF